MTSPYTNKVVHQWYIETFYQTILYFAMYYNKLCRNRKNKNIQNFKMDLALAYNKVKDGQVDLLSKFITITLKQNEIESSTAELKRQRKISNIIIVIT